jgi:hypothetical protein
MTEEKKVKHTPGSWTFYKPTALIDNEGKEDSSLGHHTYITTPSRLRVDVWGHGGMSAKETEAYAKLISSTPDLLQALKNWTAARTHKMGNGNIVIDANNKAERELILAALNAIQKAEQL